MNPKTVSTLKHYFSVASDNSITFEFFGKFSKVANYSATATVNGDNFDVKNDSVNLEVKNNSKPIPPVPPKLNPVNPYKKNPIFMKSIGVPLFALILVLFGLVGCGLRYCKKD